MKKHPIIKPLQLSVLMLCLCLVSNAQTNFYSGSIEDMKRVANDEHKSYIVEYVTPWCQACKRMDREVFGDDETSIYLNRNFYIKKADAESPLYENSARENLIGAYPTFIVYNADGQEQGRIVGFYSKYSFMNKVKEFKHKVPNNQFTEFR